MPRNNPCCTTNGQNLLTLSMFYSLLSRVCDVRQSQTNNSRAAKCEQYIPISFPYVYVPFLIPEQQINGNSLQLLITRSSPHLPLCRSTEGSTRLTRTKLPSPPRGTGWLSFVSAAGWAPERGTPRPWRGRDLGGGGWPPGHCARSRTRIWAPRIWWTSSLRLWMLTSWLRRNASLRPLTHRSSSSSDPPGWTFGTLGLRGVKIACVNPEKRGGLNTSKEKTRDPYLDPLMSAPKWHLPASSFAKTTGANLALTSS